jgi:hypothetical protein
MSGTALVKNPNSDKALGIDSHTMVMNDLNQPRELVQAEPVTGLFG